MVLERLYLCLLQACILIYVHLIHFNSCHFVTFNSLSTRNCLNITAQYLILLDTQVIKSHLHLSLSNLFTFKPIYPFSSKSRAVLGHHIQHHIPLQSLCPYVKIEHNCICIKNYGICTCTESYTPLKVEDEVSHVLVCCHAPGCCQG